MMLSIIVPTLNEEKNLKMLLESIKKQDFSDYKIIVADAGSKDATLQVAKSYSCIITAGGLPAKARNEGSKIAKGDFLFFLDADTFLPDNFFKNTFEELEKRKLKVASYRLIPHSREKRFKFYLNFFYNWPIIILEKILPHGADGIIIEKSIFEKIGRFDESIKLAEDHYMVRQAAKLGKFGIIKSTKVFISDRRFRTDGWIRTGLKYLFCELYMIFVGPAKSEIFKYKFDHYNKKLKI